MRPPATSLCTLLMSSWLLAGCGLTVPRVQEIWDSDIAGVPGADGRPKITGSAQIEFEIERKVYCELKDAVRAAQIYDVTESDTLVGKQTVAQRGLIPRDWGALVALSLQVDESTSLNPGLSVNTVLPNNLKTFSAGTGGTVTTGQSRGVGFGATLSSTATRIDKWNPSWSINFLNEEPTGDSVCLEKNDPFKQFKPPVTPAKSSPFILESDLGIKDWLLGTMFVNDLLPSDSKSDSSGGNKAQSISYEVKFVIVSSGSVTPTWKLVRITADTSGTLFAAGRTRTHDLIITLGPTSGSQSTQTNYSHLASQVGQAVSGSNAARATQ